MLLRNIIVFVVLILKNIFVNGSLLLYSSRNIKIPALQTIQQDDLNKLLSKMNNPKIVTFNYENVNKNVLEIFDDKYSCYIPNADITFENATVLMGNKEQDRHIIKRTLRPFRNEENIIIALVPLKKRLRRDTDSLSTTELPNSSLKVLDNNPTGPVLFNASLKDSQTVMIYSSKPLLLRMNNITSLNLGNPISSSTDTRDGYVRLIVTIQVKDSKVVLRFKFPWLNGYWSLTDVVVVDKDAKQYNLSIKDEIKAPRRFSYHCGGETVFRDNESDTELILYEIQAQPDARNNAFSDAYNCVPFTTIPIWSGLFVTFILIVGLVIGIGALGNIKTMDRFDNYKTKQLSITVVE